MRLFIDDVRWPKDVGFKDEDWHIVRSYDEAIMYIKEHKPQRIAFDHDLADAHYAGTSDEKTGYSIAQYLVNLDMDEPAAGYITTDFDFSSHSANPAGKRRIVALLHRYMIRKFFE